MADVKFTGLSAVTPPINKSSLVAAATFDGVTTYTSEKVTISQLADSVFLMDAEQKITFDSSGTNKVFATDSSSGADIQFNASGTDDVLITSDNGGYTEGWAYIGNDAAQVGYDSNNLSFDSTSLNIFIGGTSRINANTTGLGFFNSTPVAKPTGVAVNATAIHAALVSLGLIGV